MSSILRTISRYQQIQLEKKGAMVTDGLITAPDDVLWRTISPYQRKELEKLGQVALSGDDGEAPYIAKAVHFDNNSFIRQIDQNNAYPNSDAVSISQWIKCDDLSAFPQPCGLYWDPGSPTTGGIHLFTGDNFTTDIAYQVNPTTNNSSFYTGGSADGVFTAASWHHIYFATNANLPNGDKVAYLYFDGVDVIDPANNSDNTDAFTLLLNGSTTILEGGSIAATRKAYDLCDVQVFSQLIIPNPTNLSKFIAAGKPVNPTIPAAAFGAPQLLFSGDADGFPINQGTWGTTRTEVTGTLTNASTSPSD